MLIVIIYCPEDICVKAYNNKIKIIHIKYNKDEERNPMGVQWEDKFNWKELLENISSSPC